MLKKVSIAVGVTLIVVIVLLLSIYRITFNDDGYNMLVINRSKGEGFGITFIGNLEIWKVGTTVHGGRAERPLYYQGKWWAEEEPAADWDKMETMLFAQLKADDRFKTDAEIHQAIGYSLIKTDNQWERAAVHFNKAVSMDPNLYLSWYNLGLIYDGETGRECFRNCIKANPDFAPAYYWLGYSLCRYSRDKEALPIFKEYLEVAKDILYEENRFAFASKVVEELKAGKEGENLKTIRIQE